MYCITNVMILVRCIEDKATFKCLGCTKEKYQDCLRVVRDRLQKQVPVSVRLLKEDDNPVDKQAVAFQCQQDEGGSWTTFGYAARELTGHVRKALDRDQVCAACFKWVKWRSWGGILCSSRHSVVAGSWPYDVHAKSSF